MNYYNNIFSQPPCGSFCFDQDPICNTCYNPINTIQNAIINERRCNRKCCNRCCNRCPQDNFPPTPISYYPDYPSHYHPTYSHVTYFDRTDRTDYPYY